MLSLTTNYRMKRLPRLVPARSAILRGVRTDHAKAVRRLYGDRGGRCRFSDRYYLPATDGCSNTITGIQKDNLLFVEYIVD